MNKNSEVFSVLSNETGVASFSIPDGYVNSSRAKEVFVEVLHNSNSIEVVKIINSFNDSVEKSGEQPKKLGMLELKLIDHKRIMVFSQGDKLVFVLVGIL